MFTPIETSIGALLLHQATSILLFQNGTLLGASGYMRQLFSSPSKGTLAFFTGMTASILPLKLFLPEFVTVYPPVPTSLLAALATVGVGVFVGWGTKVSMGCTSGHMLCGLSRLNAWSAAAVATFFPVAIITHHLVHPSLRTEVCPAGVPCYTPLYASRESTISLVLFAAVTMVTCQLFPRLVASMSAMKTKGKNTSNSATNQAVQFAAGLEFALGLHITQMSSPSKVLSFLSFPSLNLWDPSMLLVIVFGILPSLLEIQLRGLNAPPLFNQRFELPKKGWKDVDWKFVAGAAAFGVGWGLTGTCPGPAVLRSISQPSWGVMWMGGFWLGGNMVADRKGDEAESTCM